MLFRSVTVRFGSRMGYRAYHALVNDVVAHAPAARRCALTEQVRREPPPVVAVGPRTVAVAAALVVVVTWALVA